MAVIAKAKFLFKNDVFVGYCGTFEGLPCEKIGNSPKKVWLQKGIEGNWAPTFEDPKDPNALSGVWVSIDGVGYVIDGKIDSDVDGDVSLLGACNECCGSTPEITPVINGNFPDVAVQATTFTLVREDLGDASAQEDVSLDYFEYIVGSVSRTSYNPGTGESTYTFKSVKDPIPQGDDTFTETARVFNSNTTSALGNNEQYQVDVIVNGDEVGEPVNAASLAAMVTALNNTGTNPDKAALGTWSTASNKMVLTTTAVDNAIITLSKVPTA